MLSIWASAPWLSSQSCCGRRAQGELGRSLTTEGPTVTWHRQKVKNREYQRKEKVEFNPPRHPGNEKAKTIGDI